MSDKLPLLDRCPFCGEEPEIEEMDFGGFMASCPECGAQMPVYPTIELAAEAWNERFDALPTLGTFTLDELDAIRRMLGGRYPRGRKLPDIEQSIIDKCNHALARSKQ